MRRAPADNAVFTTPHPFPPPLPDHLLPPPLTPRHPPPTPVPSPPPGQLLVVHSVRKN